MRFNLKIILWIIQRSAALDNDWGSEPLDGDNIADMFREARQPSSRFQTPPVRILGVLFWI